MHFVHILAHKRAWRQNNIVSVCVQHNQASDVIWGTYASGCRQYTDYTHVIATHCIIIHSVDTQYGKMTVTLTVKHTLWILRPRCQTLPQI